MPKKSPNYYKQAGKYLIGGVDSPLRAFAPVGGKPLQIVTGCGSRVTGQDGKEYQDHVLSYGALILGHGHPAVVKAVKAARRG